MIPSRYPLPVPLLALLFGILAAQQAGAVALRPNKATDDSVCDLTHHTNLYLGMVFKTPCSPRWFEGPSRGTIAS